MIDHEREGELHILTMNNGPNAIDPAWQARMLELLDAVESSCEGHAALVLTGEGKFFCNGLNVEAVLSLQGEEAARFGSAMLEIMRRLLRLPLSTVAAVNGHAFAAGAFLSLACDYRIMRADRGWFCISEVDVGVPIGIPMMRLLQAKVSPQVARDAVLSGKRYAAEDAILAGFADASASEASLLGEAKKLALSLASKERKIFGTLKRQLNDEMAAAFGPEPQ